MSRFIVPILVCTLAAAICLTLGVSYEFGLRQGKKLGDRPTLISVDAPKAGRVQGEFEHQDAMILGFNELIEYHSETLVQIVRATKSRIQIIGVVKTLDQKDRVNAVLRSNDIDPEGILYFVWPSDLMWVQDYGPKFIVDDSVTMVDFDYRPEHGENADFENLFSVAFAARFHFPYTHSHITLEGGNLLSNGDGICLSTTTLISQNSNKRQLNHQEIASRLGASFRFNRWTYLEPLKGDPVGHVDTFATFVSPDHVVVGAYDMEQDPVNAQILDNNAEILSRISTARGPLRVTRIKRPPNVEGHFHSYTNVIFANGVVLVPQYPSISPDLDRQALETYQSLLPTWQVVGIDATSLIKKRGALHCIYASVPRLPEANN